ncbi:hypothetical protein [Kordia sp.]|uniref:hypothetical protein n=1 Tax=Kordia sp. TaxID=1965332 RepID=UPI003D6A297A
MKKSLKKIQLKKRSISALNVKEVKGGTIPITPFITVGECKTMIYIEEDICFTERPQER